MLNIMSDNKLRRIYIYVWDFSNPSRIARVQTASEVVELVNKWNGVTPCYLMLTHTMLLV